MSHGLPVELEAGRATSRRTPTRARSPPAATAGTTIPMAIGGRVCKSLCLEHQHHACRADRPAAPDLGDTVHELRLAAA